MRGLFFLTVTALFAFAVFTPPKPVPAPGPVHAAVSENAPSDVNSAANVWDGESGIPADVIAAEEPEEVPPEEQIPIAVEESDVVPDTVSAETVASATDGDTGGIIEAPTEEVTIETEEGNAEEEEYVPEPIVEDPVLVIPENENEESALGIVEPVPEVNIVEELIEAE